MTVRQPSPLLTIQLFSVGAECPPKATGLGGNFGKEKKHEK
jgi:hypothetical protein